MRNAVINVNKQGKFTEVEVVTLFELIEFALEGKEKKAFRVSDTLFTDFLLGIL